MKKLRIAAIAGLILVAVLALMAWAGDKDHAKMDVAQMKEMFSQCGMCKHLVPYVDKAWFNTWSMDVYNLKDGMVMIERVGDKSGMADYKTLFATFEKAGAECEKMTTAEAKKQLCEHCQNMHGLMKAGAKYEWVLSKDGSVGVIRSDEAGTVTQIHAFADQCRQMFAQQ